MKINTVANRQNTRIWLVWLRLASLCAWLAFSPLMAAATCPKKAPAWGEKDQLHLENIELLEAGWDSNCRLYVASRERKLMRLDASGQPDKKFGKEGVVTLSSWASQMIVDDARQRILWLYYSHGSATLNIEIHALTMDGQPKPDFGRAGVIKMVAKREHDTGVGTSGRGRMLLQADGSLLVAAQVESVSVDRSLVWLFKVSSTGTAISGDAASLLQVKTSNNRAIHLIADGSTGAWFFSPDDPGAILARINERGQLDSEFATRGILKLEGTTEAAALLADKDGVVVAGSWRRIRPALTRYQANGTIDQRFGDGGKIDLQASALRKDFLLTVGVGGSDFISAQGLADGKSINLQSWRRDGLLDINWGNNGNWTLVGAELHHVSLLRDTLGRLFLLQSVSRTSKDKTGNTRITRIPEPTPSKAAARKPNPVNASVTPAPALTPNASAITSNAPVADIRPAKVENISPRAVRASVAAPASASAAVPVSANPNEIWKYTDERGVPNFVNSQSQVPEQFKKSAVRMSR